LNSNIGCLGDVFVVNSNIGCLVDGTYIKISGRARTGGKYSAPTILIDSFVIQAILIFPFIFYSIIFNEKEKLAIRTVLIKKQKKAIFSAQY